MKYILSILALAATVTMAPDAFAEGGKHHGKHMKEIDANGDGVISRAEYMSARQKKMEEHFSRMDTDGDGNLTSEEMKAGRKEMHKRMKERREERKERRKNDEEAE